MKSYNFAKYLLNDTVLFNFFVIIHWILMPVLTLFWQAAQPLLTFHPL